MNERIRQKRRQARNRILLVLGLLLMVFLVLAAYYTKPEQSLAALAEKLSGTQSGELRAGAARQAAMLAKIQLVKLEKAREAEVVQEEILQVPPSLRLANTIDFDALQEQNPDVYAWITIPNTLVDYPILQHPTDDEYYLNHTIDHAAGLPGSIYSEAIHPKDFTAANTILYGHNMKNDTMFGSLHDYENRDFFIEQPYVYIHLPERTLVYEIFAAVTFQSVYLPYYLDFEEESDFLAYVDELRESPGNVDLGMDIPFGSRLLTLHTCIGHDENHRYLVVGALIGEYSKIWYSNSEN